MFLSTAGKIGGIEIMRKSAGILLYKQDKKQLEVFLVHPGGPFWKGKESGAWSIPKGEFAENEEPLAAAQREFLEETGKEVGGNFLELSPVRQKAGKTIYAWALKGEIDPTSIVSNTFRAEWPYKSGKWQNYPEVDKAAWFPLEKAREKINPAQAALLDELVHLLSHVP